MELSGNFYALQDGSVYEWEGVLPADEDMSRALRLYTADAVTDCYVDGTLIFSYGSEELRSLRFIPRGYHLIFLPEKSAGQTLLLRFTAVSSLAFRMESPVLYGSVHDLLVYRVRESRLVLFVGIFLAVFGLFLIGFSFLPDRLPENARQMRYGGLCALDTGLYALSLYQAFFFLTTNPLIPALTEYLTQLLFPLLIALFMREITSDRMEQRLFSLVASLHALILLSAVLLQLLRICPLPSFLPFFTRFSILSCAVLVVAGLRIMRRTFLSIRRLKGSAYASAEGFSFSGALALFGGIFVLLLSILLDLLVSQILPLLNRPVGSSYSHVISLLGMALYALLLILSFFYQSAGAFIIASREKILSELAYTDALTKLPNRAYCELFLDDLTREHGSFAVVSMDVNDLKKTNDTLGHQAGDELLKNFADVLRTSFRSSDVVGRISGDEFIVVMRDVSPDECREKMLRLTDTLSISVSWGFAHSYEVMTRNAREVYKTADARMYQMKQRLHKEAERGEDV